MTREETRQLLAQQTELEARIAALKSEIITELNDSDLKSWKGSTYNLAIRPETLRKTFDYKTFQADHADIDYSNYYRQQTVPSGLVVSALKK